MKSPVVFEKMHQEAIIYLQHLLLRNEAKIKKLITQERNKKQNCKFVNSSVVFGFIAK